MSSRIKAAFFDVDGTLSAPEYREADGTPVVGFTQEGWTAYCRRTREHAYDFCSPVAPVEAYARKLKAEGTRLYVLSTSATEIEEIAKKAFIERCFPDLFEELLSVKNDDLKTDVIERMAASSGVRLSECALIEDTYMTVLKAHVKGIKAISVANVIAGNITG